jgi:hypothetical protein
VTEPNTIATPSGRELNNINQNGKDSPPNITYLLILAVLISLSRLNYGLGGLSLSVHTVLPDRDIGGLSSYRTETWEGCRLTGQRHGRTVVLPDRDMGGLLSYRTETWEDCRLTGQRHGGAVVCTHSLLGASP